MPPAPFGVACSHPTPSSPATHFPQTASEPLVPILRLDEGAGDADALATWHQALSNALTADVPHDLLALWLYPDAGGAVLLGPEALAQDDLSVPLPSPQLRPEQSTMLEEIVRDAGYPSAVSLPDSLRPTRRRVAVGRRVCRPGRYRGMDLMVLRLAAQRLAPSLGRLARQWGGAESRGARSRADRRRCSTGWREATRSGRPRSGSPRSVSGLWSALIPHDRLELFLAGPGGGSYYRLGEHLGGPLWADPSLVLESRRSIWLGWPDPTGGCCWAMRAATRAGPAATSPWPTRPGAELRAVVGARADRSHPGSRPTCCWAASDPICTTRPTPTCWRRSRA